MILSGFVGSLRSIITSLSVPIHRQGSALDRRPFPGSARCGGQ